MFQGRAMGVTTPEGQGNPRNAGPENTVQNAMEVTFVAVQYWDEYGRSHQDVLLRMGEDYYKPPNSEDWARALKGVASWLSKGVAGKLSVSNRRVPVSDDVSVLDDVTLTARPAQKD